MNRVRALAAASPGAELAPFDYDPGPLADDEVEIAVQHCGICHSDLSVIDDAWSNTTFPVVPGHEAVGTIAAKGEAVRDLELGQTVGLGWHAAYCRTCEHCEAGDHNFCQDDTATILAHHGGFADRVRAQDLAVVPLPDGVDPVIAGPLFCGGVTVFTPMLEYGLVDGKREGDRVAVVGIGGLGQMALGFLNALGCEVTAFTSTPDKHEEARRLGAHHCLSSTDRQDLKAAARSFDFVLVTVNVSLDWDLFLNTLRPRGRLHFVGAVMEPLDLSVFRLMSGQRQVSSSPVGSPRAIARLLDFVAEHQVGPQVERYGFSQADQAIARLRAGAVRYRAVLSHELD